MIRATFRFSNFPLGWCAELPQNPLSVLSGLTTLNISLIYLNKIYYTTQPVRNISPSPVPRWDTNVGSIVESRLKELHPVMPVMFIKAVTQDKQELRSLYDCPVYKTRQRGPTYVWTFNLKSKEKPAKWVLAGAALLLQI